MKTNAIMISTEGSIVKMTARDIINHAEVVKKTNPEAYSRFISLNNSIKLHNTSLYGIAYNALKIHTAGDCALYGYKSVPEMLESMYNYSPSSTSKMLATAKYFLTEDENGLHSIFTENPENDFPLTCMYEFLQKSSVMNYRSDEIIQLYKDLFDKGLIHFESTQNDLRKIKKAVSNMILSGVPLKLKSVQNEIKQLESTQNSTAQNSTAQNSTAQNSTAQNSTAQNSTTTEISPIDEFTATLISAMDIYNDSDDKMKMEMLEIFKKLTENM